MEPFTKNLNKFIYNFHKDLGHRNARDTQIEMIRKNIFFKGISKSISEVLNK